MMNSIPKNNAKHLLFLDSFRALAAIYVLLHHAVLQSYDFIHNDYSGLKKTAMKFFYYGHEAVDVFIVISGFSLMLSIVKNDFILKGGFFHFLKRRIIRIVPPYYFATLLSLILIYFFIGTKTGTHWDFALPVTTSDIVIHALLLQDFFGNDHINHSFWSIAVEFHIYLFFPLLVLIWKKKGPLTALLTSAIIAITCPLIVYLGNHYAPALKPDFWGSYMILFTLGMLSADIAFSNNGIALFYRRFKAETNQLILYSLMIIILGGIAFLRVYLKSRVVENIYFDVSDIGVGIIAAFVLLVYTGYASKAEKPFLIRILYWKPLVFVGSFSYSIYLIHAPLLQVISQYVVLPLKLDSFKASCLLMAIALPTIVLAAYLFFWFFERPFLTMGKKGSVSATEYAAIVDPAP